MASNESFKLLLTLASESIVKKKNECIFLLLLAVAASFP